MPTSSAPSWFAPVVVSVVLGISGIAAAAVVGRALVSSLRIHHQDARITVTGSATRRIRSDVIVWRAGVRAQAPDMTASYKKLAGDMAMALAFLKAHGLDEKQITVTSASVREVHPHDKDGHVIEESTIGYVTQQTVEVRATDIERVEKASREASELIDRGVYIESEPPLYIYTQLSELKLQMLADASKDARHRADQIATNAGAKVASLLTARMGVLQVNAAFSTDVSAEGNNDKTSLEKDVLAVVTASFGVQ